VVAGTDEESKNEVGVKDLETGKQETVALDGLAGYLGARLIRKEGEECDYRPNS
jgi:histidyl-tRNA synthetase